MSPADPAFTSALIELAEMLGPLMDAVGGYRQSLIDRGFSTVAADSMVVEYHRRLLDLVFKSS